MRNRKPVQVLTILLALTLLGAYVVYSQLERNRSVISTSKSLSPPEVNGQAVVVTNGNSTNVPNVGQLTVAPGSKSNVSTLKTQTLMVAPGSKSSPVVDGRQLEQLTKPKSNAVPTAKPRGTNVNVKKKQ